MAVIKADQLAEHLMKKSKQAQKETLAKWKKAATPVVKQEIQGRIGRGLSPVEGEDNFEPYSESYKKQISSTLGSRHGKKLRPVNIKLTGRLRKSLKVRAITKGLVVWFSDKKAKWINNPQADSNNMPRRAILPLTNEKFNKKIIKRLETLYTKLFKIK